LHASAGSSVKLTSSTISRCETYSGALFVADSYTTMEFESNTIEYILGKAVKVIDSDLIIRSDGFFTCDETLIWAERANVTISGASL